MSPVPGSIKRRLVVKRLAVPPSCEKCVKNQSASGGCRIQLRLLVRCRLGALRPNPAQSLHQLQLLR